MKQLFGTKAFYKKVIMITLPIMIQNAITNFVGLLDNIMVGRVGTEQMSGVAIVNQLMFVYNLCIFGAMSGAGIFGAQFYGQRNHEGIKYTFRFKLIVAAIITIIGSAVFIFAGDALINSYLHDSTEGGDIVATLAYAKDYMWIMLIGLIPFCVVSSYSGTLRETGQTAVPMYAGITAVLVNLVLNYILIFGKFGAPELGVVGAAIATVISRFVECAIVIIWTHKHTEINKFIVGAYKSLAIPKDLVIKITKKGFPLLLNEGLWSAGMAILNQRYSTRGLSAVAAVNISSTITNLFNVVFIAMGSAVAIIVGQQLGADEKEEAKSSAYKIITLSVLSCVVIGGLLAIFAPLFPKIYNTSEEVKDIATGLIQVNACCMPLHAFMHASYFTLRSGGKTFITFLFDSVYLWVISVPLAYALSIFTDLDVVMMMLIILLVDLIKCVIGFVLVKKGVWIQNIVED